jgi:hypothetical protein
MNGGRRHLHTVRLNEQDLLNYLHRHGPQAKHGSLNSPAPVNHPGATDCTVAENLESGQYQSDLGRPKERMRQALG